MIIVGTKAPDFTLQGVFAIAVGAALLGYLIGLVVQHFFPGIAIPAG